MPGLWLRCYFLIWTLWTDASSRNSMQFWNEVGRSFPPEQNLFPCVVCWNLLCMCFAVRWCEQLEFWSKCACVLLRGWMQMLIHSLPWDSLQCEGWVVQSSVEPSLGGGGGLARNCPRICFCWRVWCYKCIGALVVRARIAGCCLSCNWLTLKQWQIDALHLLTRIKFRTNYEHLHWLLSHLTDGWQERIIPVLEFGSRDCCVA